MNTLTKIMALSVFAAALFIRSTVVYAEKDSEKEPIQELTPGNHVYLTVGITALNVAVEPDTNVLLVLEAGGIRLQRLYSNLFALEINADGGAILFAHPLSEGTTSTRDSYDGGYARIRVGAAYMLNNLLGGLLNENNVLAIRGGFGVDFLKLKNDPVNGVEEKGYLNFLDKVDVLFSGGVNYQRIIGKTFVFDVEGVWKASGGWSFSCSAGIMLK